MNKVYFSDCPTKLFSLDGLKTKIKLFTGAFVLNYATTEKLLVDMNHNGISKAVIQQINPHVCGFSIDCKESLSLIEKLSKTGLPILCCSGLGLPQDVLSTNIPSKQTKKDVQNQRLDKYEAVLDAFPNTIFILAHSGCFEFENMANLLRHHQNVYTDISIQPAEHIKTLIEKIGPERLLFGTDYPFVTQAFSILSVLRATKNEDERRLVFSENAKRLLGIDFASDVAKINQNAFRCGVGIIQARLG